MRGHKNGLDVGSLPGQWRRLGLQRRHRRRMEDHRTDPVAGSIVSYPPGVADVRNTLCGHVAVVEAVDRTAGTVTISDERAAARGIVNHRTHRIDVGAVLHPAQRQCVHQWFRRHGFHVIRFRSLRFVVIVRLVLLFGSGGGGMDVPPVPTQAPRTGGWTTTARRHPTPRRNRGLGHRPEDDRLV